MTNHPIRCTIFLDTNSLQYMASYLRLAKKLKLPPYDGVEMGFTEVRGRLRKRLPRGIAQAVMNGCSTLAYLQERTRDPEVGAAVYTSRLCLAELLHGVLDGQAHARLVRQGLSYRMRQRARDLGELISMYLRPRDFKEVRLEVDKMLQKLGDIDGIMIDFAEDHPDNISRVLEFCDVLQCLVFLDVLDCWMYACAATVQADEFVTFDGHLRKAVNLIHNPQNDPGWKHVRSELLKALRRLNPVGTPVDFILPQSRDIPNQVPRLWM